MTLLEKIAPKPVKPIYSIVKNDNYYVVTLNGKYKAYADNTNEALKIIITGGY